MISKIYRKRSCYIIVYYILQLRLLSALPSSPHLPSINRQHRPITVTPRPTRQKHHRPRNILRLAQPPTWILLRERLLPARQLHQTVGHPAREEAWRYSIHQNSSGTELDGEVLGQMDNGGFGGGVPEYCVCADGADADARDRGGDDYAGGVLDCGALLQEGCESVVVGGVSGVFGLRLSCLLAAYVCKEQRGRQGRPRYETT
jgi:hypothetical protein